MKYDHKPYSLPQSFPHTIAIKGLGNNTNFKIILFYSVSPLRFCSFLGAKHSLFVVFNLQHRSNLKKRKEKNILQYEVYK